MADGISRTQLVLLRGSLRCMVVFGFAYAVLSCVEIFGNGTLRWEAHLSESTSFDAGLALTEGVDAVWEGQILLFVGDTPLWLDTLAATPSTIAGLAVALVGLLLLRIMHETHAGQPFFDTSHRRLRLVSRVIAIAAVLTSLTHSTANQEVVDAALSSGSGAPADLRIWTTLTWLLVALVVRVIAEAFRIGTELRRDTDGLV